MYTRLLVMIHSVGMATSTYNWRSVSNHNWVNNSNTHTHTHTHTVEYHCWRYISLGVTSGRQTLVDLISEWWWQGQQKRVCVRIASLRSCFCSHKPPKVLQTKLTHIHACNLPPPNTHTQSSRSLPTSNTHPSPWSAWTQSTSKVLYRGRSQHSILQPHTHNNSSSPVTELMMIMKSSHIYHTIMHAYVHISYIHTYIRTYVRTYIHTYIRTCIYIHTYWVTACIQQR